MKNVVWPLLVRQRSVAASGFNLPAVNQALNFDGGGHRSI